LTQKNDKEWLRRRGKNSRYDIKGTNSFVVAFSGGVAQFLSAPQGSFSEKTEHYRVTIRTPIFGY